MDRIIFNPFGKAFDKVDESDLERLKTVAEGWHIEYKQEKLNGKKIAKSISSFANSRGGIYFVGIEADEHNLAKAIFGVSDSPDVIRDSVRGNLQPFPFFETYSISLQSKKSVLMVVVPEGVDTPYINSDGKIYVRQEAASDPIPETNRHAVDSLYQRAKRNKDAIISFRNSDLSFCKGEDEIPYLELFMNTKPFNHFLIDNFFGKKNFDEICTRFNSRFVVKEDIGGKISIDGVIKFDSLTTYADSISLRCLEGLDLTYNGITLYIDPFGNFKLLLPLTTSNGSNLELNERYTKILNRSKDPYYSVDFLDLEQILGAFLGLVPKYIDYLSDAGYKDELEVKFRLKNCYRKTLYIEAEEFMQHIEQFGIPICMKSQQSFPYNPITFKITELKLKPITKSLLFTSFVASALGIPYHLAKLPLTERIREKNFLSGSPKK